MKIEVDPEESVHFADLAAGDVFTKRYGCEPQQAYQKTAAISVLNAGGTANGPNAINLRNGHFCWFAHDDLVVVFEATLQLRKVMESKVVVPQAGP